MKFSLVIALSHHAELLILDEPTSGLDPVVRSEVLEILTELIQDENNGVLFSSHITSDLDKITDFVTVINEGEIILSSTKDDLVENYGVVKGGKDLLKHNSFEFIGIKENSFGFEALVSNKKEARKYFGDKVIIERPSLEDILLFHTR